MIFLCINDFPHILELILVPFQYILPIFSGVTPYRHHTISVIFKINNDSVAYDAYTTMAHMTYTGDAVTLVCLKDKVV